MQTPEKKAASAMLAVEHSTTTRTGDFSTVRAHDFALKQRQPAGRAAHSCCNMPWHRSLPSPPAQTYCVDATLGHVNHSCITFAAEGLELHVMSAATGAGIAPVLEKLWVHLGRSTRSRYAICIHGQERCTKGN